MHLKLILLVLVKDLSQLKFSQEEAESKNIEEYGTTGRRRRVGLFDMELAKESCRINGATQIALNLCRQIISRLC